MRLSLTPLSSLFLILPLLGCPPGEDEDKVDTAADADTDTDADTDADVETTPYNFAGSVTVNSTLDGATVCDAEATLTGSPYTGDCPDCDFAVDIVDDITRDDSTEDCSYFPKYSFIEAGGYYDLLMASTAEYAGEYYDYTAAFLVGYGVTYEYYGYTYDYPGPYFSPMAYDGSTYTTWARTGDEVSWSLTYASTYDDYEATYYGDCGVLELSASEDGFDGVGGTSDVDCKMENLDVWEFTADGGAVTVTVDTVADASAFDPQAWINDPSGCTVQYSDDNFACTHPPPKYECPSFELDTTEIGVYQVVVRSYGSCAGDVGTYELRVDGAVGDIVLQTQDDEAASLAVTRSLTIDVVGSGTLTAE